MPTIRSIEQAAADTLDSRLRAIGDLELVQYTLDVLLDRGPAPAQLDGDLWIGPAGSNEPQQPTREGRTAYWIGTGGISRTNRIRQNTPTA